MESKYASVVTKQNIEIHYCSEYHRKYNCNIRLPSNLNMDLFVQDVEINFGLNGMIIFKSFFSSITKLH